MQWLNELKTLYLEHPLLLTGLLLILGYFIGRLFGRMKLPEISGFILAGLLVNLLSGGTVHDRLNDSLHVVTETAIGLLALSVGCEFSVRKMRRIARNVFIITLLGLVITFVAVYLACAGVGRFFPQLPLGHPYAVLLAVIACATAPAVIVAEVHHLRAQGRFVDYLFGTVALGDAVCVVVFGLAFPVVMNLLHAESAGLYSLTSSLREIGVSLAAGGLAGVVLHFLARRIRNPAEYLIDMNIDGATILRSEGMGAHISTQPLFAGFLGFMREDHKISHTIMALIPEAHEQEILRGIESITGDLEKTRGAMVMTLDLSFCKGTMAML